MIIHVKAYPNSKQQKIELVDNVYKVRVHEKADDGKANFAVIEQLSDHFKIAKSNIRLVKGVKSREKTFEIE